MYKIAHYQVECIEDGFFSKNFNTIDEVYDYIDSLVRDDFSIKDIKVWQVKEIKEELDINKIIGNKL